MNPLSLYLQKHSRLGIMPSAVMDDGVMQDSGVEWIGAIPLARQPATGLRDFAQQIFLPVPSPQTHR